MFDRSVAQYRSRLAMISGEIQGDGEKQDAVSTQCAVCLMERDVEVGDMLENIVGDQHVKRTVRKA